MIDRYGAILTRSPPLLTVPIMHLPFRIKREFPYPVKTIENVFIPMPDGTRLSAKIWLPEPQSSEETSFPAILEYIPYRKRDVEAWQDSISHPYFAGHGYASVRVDLRGSGESDDVLRDEYLPQEQEDGLEVLKWIAAQQWCDGNIGMMGISWGGFNGLQIAALQPPELKCIITLCSTDDRYADDVHYMGGCLLGDNLSWASIMFAFNSCPPDPELVGERWREMWMNRMENSGLWLEKWLNHQHRGDYWKHGSVCEDYNAIKIPVYAISGWADGYSNAVCRMMEHLDVPRKGLIGPWSHKYPHLGVPGPAIGFLQEALRWWDHWLKDTDTGIMDEPMFRVWMQDSVPPSNTYQKKPGRWIAEDEWPSPRIKKQKYWLTDGKLRNASKMKSVPAITDSIQSPLSVGLFAGKWCSYNAPPDLPNDQREEDGGSLVYESNPTHEPMEIFGAPEIDLHFSVDKKVAQVAIRLSDVAPDDKATRITYGLLNLTHRNSHEYPEYLEPGKKYRVKIRLNDVAQQFPVGHRFRISISTSYWPLAWPPPTPVRMTVYEGESALYMPVRPPRTENGELQPFSPPEGAEPISIKQVERPNHDWVVKRYLAKDLSMLEVFNDDGILWLEDIDLEMEDRVYECYSYRTADFSSVKGEVKAKRGFKRGNWDVHTTTRTVLQSDEKYFYLHAELDAFENDLKVFSKTWSRKIPRDKV